MNISHIKYANLTLVTNDDASVFSYRLGGMEVARVERQSGRVTLVHGLSNNKAEFKSVQAAQQFLKNTFRTPVTAHESGLAA